MIRNRVYKVYLLLLAIVCQFGLPFAGFANQAVVTTPLKIGFVLCGRVTDNGWNQSHNEGRLYLEQKLNGKVQTICAESVPENAEAARVIEKMIAQGAKVIFSTSEGYFEIVLKLADRHPDVTFMQINRYSAQNKKNIGIYFAHYFEPMYTAGLVAGRMTKKNKVGFIIGHAIPSVLVVVNSFALGVQSANPKASVKLFTTHSWNDPPNEAEAVKALAENGTDVVASLLDSSLTVSRAAEKCNMYSVGTSRDLKPLVPKVWLTGQYWNYGPLYVRIIQTMLDGTWKPGTEHYYARDGYALLGSFGSVVPKAVQQEALNVNRKITTGQLKVFTGPIKDSNGKIRIPAGKVADNHCIEQMNWVVPGVEGYLYK